MSKLININQSNFQKAILSQTKLFLLEATAPWCSACKQLEPILKQILVDYKDKIAVGTLDIDQNPKLIKELKIMSVPTIIVFGKGKEKKRIFGQVSKEELLKEIEV